MNDPINISYYAVLYMDVLNQREKLSKIDELPTTDAEYDAFFDLLRNTYGVVEDYARRFEVYLAHRRHVGPPSESFSDEVIRHSEGPSP